MTTTCRRLYLSAILLLPAVAPAQVIYTCAGAGGARILQDTPCADGRQVAARHYAAPRDPPDAARRIAEVERAVHADWQADRRPATTRRQPRARASGRDLQRARCASARAQVEAAMRSRHPRADRERLEDRATDACFGL